MKEEILHNPSHSFKPHLEQAYTYWKSLLKPDDIVIDATCGNGKDTLRLAELVPDGHVYSLDIQEVALENARKLIPFSNVTFLHQSHEEFPPVSVKLIVYNLGYLPGGNKKITTMTNTTLKSISKAMEISEALCITFYPGHPEGLLEQEAVLKLDFQKWIITFHQWRENSPTLLFLKLKI